MTNVIVVQPRPGRTVAGACMKAEGIDYAAIVLTDPLDFGRTLKRLWERGNTFVLVEDDVAPTPGVVLEMLHCDSPWCWSPYPLGRGIMKGEHPGLGCVKFGRELMEASPNAWRQWGNTEWRGLDGAVARAIRPALKALEMDEEWPHGHDPSAHAQHLREES